MFRSLAVVMLSSLALIVGCGEDADDAPPPETQEPDPQPDMAPDPDPAQLPEPDRSVQDFIVTEMNFYFPEGLEPAGDLAPNPCGFDLNTDNTMYRPLSIDGLVVDGFDLDDTVTEGTDTLCGQTDHVSSDGLMGIDYGFLRVIDMIRPARPGQTIQTVLATAPSQGLIKVGWRVTGIDDLENDDDVRITVTNTLDTPLLGADGKIIGRGSVAADPDPTYRTTLQGQIVDGVLTAGPADLSIGHINLLVIEDRVISLKDARIRATFDIRPDGVVEVESLVSGWWLRDNMLQAVEQAIRTIGANRGEIECVLDEWSDYSSDGESCDGMSMIFRVTAVSGFITDMETPEGGDSDASE